MQRRQKKLLGFGIDTFNEKEALKYADFLMQEQKSSHIVTINPEIIEYSKKHSDFAEIIHNAELVIPDGIGIKIGLKLNGVNIQRITGIGFARALLENAQSTGISVALVGARQQVIEKTYKNLKFEMPNLNITYYHNGYFKDCEQEVINNLTETSPKLLLIALGSPMQEKFINKLKSILPSTLMIGIGGSFDVWAGEVQRAPEIFQKLGLEWLYRTVKQPERFKRIFPTLPLFVYNVVKEKFTKKG